MQVQDGYADSRVVLPATLGRVTTPRGAPPPVMNNARVAFAVAVLLSLVLLLLPTGDGSYGCHRPPATLLVVPAKENPLLRQDFFDEGYQCNRDARRRGVEALAVLVGGSLLAVALPVANQAEPRVGAAICPRHPRRVGADCRRGGRRLGRGLSPFLALRGRASR